MLNVDLRGKKLLLVGGLNTTADLVFFGASQWRKNWRGGL